MLTGLFLQYMLCAASACLLQYDGYPVYRLQYKLPAGFTCDRCILQWYYMSGAHQRASAQTNKPCNAVVVVADHLRECSA